MASILGGVGQVSMLDNQYDHNPDNAQGARGAIEQGEMLSSPYILFGPTPFAMNYSSGGPYELLDVVQPAYLSGSGSACAPSIKRFVINVSPIRNIPDVDTTKTDLTGAHLLNFDTAHLYAGNYSGFQENVGASWADPTAEGTCGDKYSCSEGVVFDSPMPIRGAPVKFRKVYFNATEGDNGETGCVPSGYPTYSDIESSGGAGRFYAYFLCSSPIANDVGCDTDGASPRNDNWGYMEGLETDWGLIDVGGGGGGGSSVCDCPFDIVKTAVTPATDPVSYSISIRPGTINGLLPSNWSSVGTYSNEDTKFLVLNVTTDKTGVTAADLSLQDSYTDKIDVYANGAPLSFKVLIGNIASGAKWQRAIGCSSLSALPTEAFITDNPDDPLRPTRHYTWEVRSGP